MNALGREPSPLGEVSLFSWSQCKTGVQPYSDTSPNGEWSLHLSMLSLSVILDGFALFVNL